MDNNDWYFKDLKNDLIDNAEAARLEELARLEKSRPGVTLYSFEPPKQVTKDVEEFEKLEST